MVSFAKNFVTALKIYAATFLDVREITVHWILFRSLVAYLCHYLSDNNEDLSDLYVVLSDLYVDLSVLYVGLSDLDVDLSLIHLLENKS